MKSQLSRFKVLLFAIAGVAGVHNASITVNGQSLDNSEIPAVLTTLAVEGEPERIDLDEGNYKLVYRNKDKQPVKVLEFGVAGGSMIQVVKMIKSTKATTTLDSGKSIGVEVETFEESQTTLTGVRRKGIATYLYVGGTLKEKVVHRVNKGQTDYGYRTITRYEAGGDPNGIARREKQNATGKWVADSPFSGTWYVEKDGKREAGEYTFLESPAVFTIQHDAKTWLLMLNPQSETHPIALPASSKDHLGFAGRLIELRGNADAGRLEFWLTRDLVNAGFQKSSFALIREDN